MIKFINDKKGITLITLVITIIILLILAGITISTLSGSGLFKRAEESREKTQIAQAEEKLKMAIMNLKAEEINGDGLTIDDLTKLNSNEIEIVINENREFPVEAVCDNYKFNIDENFNVTYIEDEKKEKIEIAYETEPKGYTNQDEVKISIKVSSSKGIKTIKWQENEPINLDGTKEKQIDYTVTTNGTYSFEVIDNKGNKVVKDIIINQIDKLSPKDFTIEITKNESGKSIVIANAEDNDATPENAKSGIDYYEYYIVDTNNNETKLETNVIDTQLNKYTIYAVAYDKAGNRKESNAIDIGFNSELKQEYELGNQSNTFTTYRGNPEYRGKEEGVYLKDSIISTQCTLNNTYTIILETKNIEMESVGNYNFGILFGFGSAGSGIGGTLLGIGVCDYIGSGGSVAALTGAGDAYNLYYPYNQYEKDKWNKLAIKYDGSNFTFFINDKKIGTSQASAIKGGPLYIGGIVNSGTTSAGVNWKCVNGNYRNIAIYDGTLSDKAIQNYVFK